MIPETKTETSLHEQLVDLIGAEYVLSDDASRSLYAQDVFTKSIPTGLVVRPANKHELAEVVSTATQAGWNVIARGGGMSYTSGYVPIQAETITIDTSRMNRILEINTDDMYVTVEAGVTWQALHEALKPSGFRTPFWGSLSGLKATVGGGMSQNAIFWGTGQHGSAADSVIGLEVVLADGSIVATGSGAQLNAKPFFRHFGPDLTGLFSCDAGALGFKAAITLRLIKQMQGRQFAAFDFKRGEDAIQAMSEIARRGLASECFGFDPFLQAQRMKRESLAKDVKAFAGVLKNSGSVMGAIKDGAKVALAGRRYMDDVDHSVQIMIEDFTQAGADAKAKEISAIAESFNGREIENSIPKIVRANPFGPVNNMLGPEGERWVPSHVLVSHSSAVADYHATLALFDEHREEFEKYQIETGFLYATISTNAFVLEPVFFWPDSYTEIHEASVESDHLARLKKFPEDLAAREVVGKVRKKYAALFRERGGVHMQLGKAYRYADGIQAETLAVIQAVKQVVDPHNQVNPGALGLGLND